jgi:predicted  nucleic acid-binding Zn-ribbon protein
MANENISSVKDLANDVIGLIRRDIEQAQKNFHEADEEANKWENRKQRGTLSDEDILKDAQEQRQQAWAELQRQKARMEKVEDWRNQKVQEIRDLRDRAQNGDYHGYRRLRHYNVGAVGF